MANPRRAYVTCSSLRNRRRSAQIVNLACIPVWQETWASRVPIAAPLKSLKTRGTSAVPFADTLERSMHLCVRRMDEPGMARHSKIAFLLLLCCFGSVAQSQEPNAGKGTLYGTVFLRDSQGAQSFVAGAKVKLTGAATLESESDTKGEFVIVAVPNGTFTVEVNWPGLKAIETVQVDSRNVHLSIELKPEQLVTSVVVKADPSENVSAASSQTISDTTLRDAPNVDDRFESALPLVPGVVRGPDGHVNLKGTPLLLLGAVCSFLAVGWQRRRLAAGRPEQLLGIWHSHADSRSSNRLLYLARHMEFMVRRCFFPYALVVFALFGITNVAFILSVIGANLVWPITLYSSRAFAPAANAPAPDAASCV